MTRTILSALLTFPSDLVEHVIDDSAEAFRANRGMRGGYRTLAKKRMVRVTNAIARHVRVTFSSVRHV